MTAINGQQTSRTYTNPVYKNDFADPFVLKFCGEYYAYCTGFWNDGNVFGILHSRDLVNWTPLNGAMSPLEHHPPFYWAPEITYSNGKFYLYYSVGNETLMEIRVAVSDRPDGGFVDSGNCLTTADFAIDAHVFTDHTGEKYLFYATDFLEHSHIGTGTVVDKMIDFFTLEGNPRPVTRAGYDWQIYDPKRKEKGGVRWHTVEGAFVFKHKNLYYEMFSGGNWQNTTYGVSFATTADIEKNEEWQQFSDGEKVLPILRTIPGAVIGPGHNSVVRGVNNRELYCVYHRRTENGRVLAIDRMDFAGGARLFINGATNSPQPAPFKPKMLDFFDQFSHENREIASGQWQTQNNQMISAVSENAELVCRQKAKSFLLETSLRLVEDKGGRFGIILRDGDVKIFGFFIEPRTHIAKAVWFENEPEKSKEFALAANFDLSAFHLLRIETDYFKVKLTLDEQVLMYECNLEKVPVQFSFASENCSAAFAGTALTVGFENLFEKDELELTGWRKIAADCDCKIENQNLMIINNGGEKTIFRKGMPKNDYQLTVNFRITEIFSEDFIFGFCPVFDEKTQTPFISFKVINGNWILQVATGEHSAKFPLPEHYSLSDFHQFSFLKIADKLIMTSETEKIGTITVPEIAAEIAFTIRNAAVVFDMVRVTGL